MTTPKDRLQHRIDTGSPEERVNPNQTRERAIERFNSWPKWKREAFTYRKPEDCTCLDNIRCFGCKPEDQMTASDHLKHRTGSLGGDQDEKLVEQPTIPSDMQKLYRLCKDHEFTSDHKITGAELCAFIERIGKAETEAVDAEEYGNEMEHRWDEGEKTITDLMIGIKQLEAALAQKTRECEELKRKYFEIERAHSRAVDKISDLTARVQLREKDLAERGSQKSAFEQENIQLREKISGMAELHQAQKMYHGKASFEFHAGNSQTGFQADGFQVIVNHHVIAECEDSEVADFICKAWNEVLQAQVEQLQRKVAELSKPVTAKDNWPLSTLRIHESEEL